MAVTLWIDSDHYITVQQTTGGGGLFAIVRLGIAQSGHKPSGLSRGRATHVIARGRVKMNTLQVTRSDLSLSKLRTLLTPGGLPLVYRGSEIKITKAKRR